MSALSFGCVVLVKFLKSISRKRCLVKYYPPLLWGGGGKVRKMCIKQLISKVTELCSCSLCSFANWHACLVMRLQKESPASDFQILSIEDRGSFTCSAGVIKKVLVYWWKEQNISMVQSLKMSPKIMFWPCKIILFFISVISWYLRADP